jgi:hypothetical protein
MYSATETATKFRRTVEIMFYQEIRFSLNVSFKNLKQNTSRKPETSRSEEFSLPFPKSGIFCKLAASRYN